MRFAAVAVAALALVLASPTSWAGGAFASATASVTVRIVPPHGTTIPAISVSTDTVQIDRFGNGSFSLYNNGASSTQITVQLAGQSGSNSNCGIRYSPAVSQLPPGGEQVVRLLRRGNGEGNCQATELVVNSGDTNQQLLRVAVLP